MTSPLAIMLATIAIIVVSFYSVRRVGLDRRIASFGIMDTLHIIVACSSGNMPCCFRIIARIRLVWKRLGQQWGSRFSRISGKALS